MSIKRLFIVAMLVTLISFPYGANTSATNRGIYSIKAYNSPLTTNSGKILNVRYSLNQRSSVNVRIYKGRYLIKTLKRYRIESKGRHSVKWSGRDTYGRLVDRGDYQIHISARDRRRHRTFRARKGTRVINTKIFSTHFNRNNGLLADNYGHNDPLGKWDVTSQKLYTVNRHGYTDSPVFRVRTNKSDFINFELNADVMKKDLGVDNWEGIQLFFRYNDPDNLYYAGLRNDNQVHIKKKVNGVYTTLAISEFDSNKLDYWYKLKIVANGSHLEFHVDGQKILEADDSSFSSGKVGLRTDNLTALFDNFIVYSL